MRAAVVLGIVIVAASSCLTEAEARGRRGGGGGGWGSSAPTVWVNGYTKRDGTSVAGHYRTKADGVLSNNLSYRGGGVTPVSTYQRTASADPAASLPQPVAPLPSMPWCSDGTIVSGFCVLN